MVLNASTTATQNVYVDMVVLEERFCSVNFTNSLTYPPVNGFRQLDPVLLAIIFQDYADDPIQYTVREGFRELPKIIEELKVNDLHFVKFV